MTEYVQGGIATYLNTLVEEQSRDAHWNDYRILTCREHAEFLSVTDDERLVTFPYDGRKPEGWKQLSRAYRSAVSEFAPDIVHIHSSFPGVIVRLGRLLRPFASAKKRPGFVYCAHGWSFRMEQGRLKKWTYRTIERIFSRACDRIVCISQDEFDAAIRAGIPSSKCRLIHNALPRKSPDVQDIAIPAAVRDAKARGERVLLFVGRYDRQKGLDLLLDAIGRLTDHRVHLICAGGSVVSHESIKFGDNTHDLGWVTPGQVVCLLEFCDALVVPSRWEGFGLVAAEAMRAGRAVICSGEGGLPEVVENGVTGTVLQTLNGDSIARAVLDLSPERLRDMGEAGRERFLRLFTAEIMYQKTKRVYEEVLAGRPQGA